MNCFVYVLGTATPKGPLTYVGWTQDVERRLGQHNAGRGARFTRGRIWVLLHQECCASRQDAMRREWHLKRDRAFRKKLAAGIKTQARRQHSGMSAAVAVQLASGRRLSGRRKLT